MTKITDSIYKKEVCRLTRNFIGKYALMHSALNIKYFKTLNIYVRKKKKQYNKRHVQLAIQNNTTRRYKFG